MGFSTVASTILFFFTIIIAITAFIIIINSQNTTIYDAQTESYASLEKSLHTDITLTNVTYATNVTITALNTGATIINPNELEIYVLTTRIERDNVSRSYEILTELRNPDLWDPEEQLTIEFVPEELPVPSSIPITVITSTGAKDTIVLVLS